MFPSLEFTDPKTGFRYFLWNRNQFSSIFEIYRPCFKATVQFETEGNGQNEIVSHMERSEVRL